MARGRKKDYPTEKSVMVNIRTPLSLLDKLEKLAPTKTGKPNISKAYRLCAEAYFALKEINEKRGKK